MSAPSPQTDAAQREEPGTRFAGACGPRAGLAARAAITGAMLCLWFVRAAGGRERDTGGHLRLLPAQAQRAADRGAGASGVGVRLLRGLLRV